MRSSMQLFSRVSGLRFSFSLYPPAQKLVSCSPLNRLLPFYSPGFIWWGCFNCFCIKERAMDRCITCSIYQCFFFFIMLSLFILKFFPLIIIFFFYLVKLKMSGTTGPKKMFLRIFYPFCCINISSTRK